MPDDVTLPDLPVPDRGDFAGAEAWMRQLREIHVPRRAGEGLREHKKRITRQQISDTATWMMCERGFANVRVADVAAAVGVSEKTVYNYFPTKEAMVFDREEEMTEVIVGALRARGPGVSPVRAMLTMMDEEQARFGSIPAEALWMVRAVDELMNGTPELVAAQRAMTKRIVAAIAETLAEGVELDPRDPEPQVVAHALMGMWETSETSFSRHIDAGLAGEELTAAIRADTERAGRVLETGLWAYDLVDASRGRARSREQLVAIRATLDEGRRQIARAMREARQNARRR